MYMVEIAENKIDTLIEHVGKGLKSFNKVMECLGEMKDKSFMAERYEDDEDEEDYEMNERYGNRGGRSGGRSNMRRGGGRYSRY